MRSYIVSIAALLFLTSELHVRNRARTLAKLGRLSEAIEAWKQTGTRARLSKYAEEQIAKLQNRINPDPKFFTT